MDMKSKYLMLMLKILGGLILLIVLLAFTLPFIFQKQIVATVKKAVNDNLTAKVEWTDYSLSLFRSKGAGFAPPRTAVLNALMSAASSTPSWLKARQFRPCVRPAA